MLVLLYRFHNADCKYGPGDICHDIGRIGRTECCEVALHHLDQDPKCRRDAKSPEQRFGPKRLEQQDRQDQM